MAKSLRPQSGVTLIEVLIALAVLGITVGGITTLQNFSLRQTQSIYQRSDFIKTLESIEIDLVQEMDSIAYRDNSEFVSGVDFDSKELKATFDAADVSQICFSLRGFRVELADPSCEILVSYYKVREEDRLYSSDKKLAGSSFMSAPISRLLYRVTFKDKGLNQARVYYFSRLKSHVLLM